MHSGSFCRIIQGNLDLFSVGDLNVSDLKHLKLVGTVLCHTQFFGYVVTLIPERVSSMNSDRNDLV